MAVVPVVRLLGFRPIRPAFDNAIRDWIVPGLRSKPGAIDAFAGRQGPEELGPRLVASVWETRDAMESAFDGASQYGELQVDGLDGIADVALDVLATEVAYHADGPVVAPRIIRVLRGCARPGQLARYVEETRAGVAADVAAGHGPVAFYLGRDSTPESFVAVSVWSGWAAIELATGGDVRQPQATRRPELIESFDATHYEAIDL